MSALGFLEVAFLGGACVAVAVGAAALRSLRAMHDRLGVLLDVAELELLGVSDTAVMTGGAL